MLVKALKRYWDADKNGWRDEGEAFEATAKRVSEINGAGFGTLVEAQDSHAKDAPKRRAPKGE